MTKNTEILVDINNVKFIILLPIDKGRMDSIQSTKSKNKDKIELLMLKGGNWKETAMKTVNSWKDLVEKQLIQIFEGKSFKYREANNLCVFNNEIIWLSVEAKGE